MAFDLLSYTAMFDEPATISSTSAWVSHIPFAMALVQMARPLAVVELGTHQGDSYLAFCQAVRTYGPEAARCFAVDTWRGDEHAGTYDGPAVLNALRRCHDEPYGRFSTLLQMKFDDAVARFDNGQIDLLHIDGLHTYEAVLHDFKTWLPKVSERGVVLFHDTAERAKDFGVWRVWEELSARYPGFAFGHGHGLGVLAVGARVPPEVLGLIEYANHRPAEVRGLFARLGERVELHQQFLRTLEAVHQARLVAQQWGQRTGTPTNERPPDGASAVGDPLGYAWSAAREMYAVADADVKLREAYTQLQAENRRLKGG